MTNIKKIENYEILTPSGYSGFSSIDKKEVSILFTILFTDGSQTKCSENHLFKFPTGEFAEASILLPGDILDGGKEIKDIAYETGNFTVYGIHNVEKNEEYISDGFVSHNCAFIDNVDDIWVASQSTLSTGGNAILLSTPNGIGNFFHKTWINAGNGHDQNGFNTIKLHWSVHPERDQAWRDNQEKLLGQKGAAQECDCSFVTSGDSVIAPEILSFYEKSYIQEPIEKVGFDGNLWKWEYPDYNKSYMVTADVARGDGGDYSACHVIEIESTTQVAEYRGKLGTKEFGNFLVALATEYNEALLVVENANIGWAVIQQIINREYGNLFYMSNDLKYVDVERQMTNKYKATERKLKAGFSTNINTRPLIISKLDLYFKENALTLRSQRTIDELFVFIWKNGKAEARSGYNDDLVMALAIGLWVRDTALRLRQEGIDLTASSISSISSVNTPTGFYSGTSYKENPWSMNVNGEDEDISWLLK